MHGHRSTRVRDRSISSQLQLRLPLCLARSLLIRIRTRRDLTAPSGRVQGGIQHRRWHGMLIAIRKLLRKHLFQIFLYVYPEPILVKYFRVLVQNGAKQTTFPHQALSCGVHEILSHARLPPDSQLEVREQRERREAVGLEPKVEIENVEDYQVGDGQPPADEEPPTVRSARELGLEIA